MKHQISLVDIVSPYVQLKRTGRSWKGLSPFTQEKTPSFYVHPDRGFYKCFSTGEGGDLFTFVMKMENLEFIEAVEFIAEKFSINLEYEKGKGPSRDAISLRKQLLEIHELATNWYHDQFIKNKEATAVRDYWTHERGFDMKLAVEFKIGYAPASLNAFAQFCLERKISLAAMHRSGLFYARENESDYTRFKSRFRGRLMIPIRDVQGRVVAFTARQLPQTPNDDPAREAKYVNSPETPIFHKGRILFGIDHARTHIKEGGSFLLVEGQLDAIRCWSVGLHTAVAPQGTALTDEQLTLIRRYDPKSVECLLDGDAAGRKAALNYIPMALKAALDFRYLLLPEKTDPDDLLREQGSDALNKIKGQAWSSMELYVNTHAPNVNKLSPEEKKKVLYGAFELVQLIDSAVLREDYRNEAARLLGWSYADMVRSGSKTHKILEDYNRWLTQKPSIQENETVQQISIADTDGLLTQVTWELLWLLLHFPKHGSAVSENIDYDWINAVSPTGRLLRRLLAEFREGLIENTLNLESLIETIEDRKLLAEINTRDLEVDSPKVQIINCIKTLYRNYLFEQKQKLEEKITNTDPDDALPLMRKVSQIRKALNQPLQIEL